MSDIVHVSVAVIVNSRNEVCISLRHKKAHQGGLWEFPGGKVEQGEAIMQALFREIREEIDIEIIQARPLMTIHHHYGDKSVCLHVFRVVEYHGEATGLEGQQVKWLPVSLLSASDFPVANGSIIKAVQLPDKYLITGKFTGNDDFLYKLKKAINSGIKLIQLRLKDNSCGELAQVQVLLEQTARLCTQAEVLLMLNLSPACLDQIDLSQIVFAGFHADSKALSTLSQRPAGRLFSASCHNIDELLMASKLNADFAVLSPVQKTASHPDMPAMGWSQFSCLLENTGIPVYALGGVSTSDLETAWSHGAQGVAAISALWEN